MIATNVILMYIAAQNFCDVNYVKYISFTTTKHEQYNTCVSEKYTCLSNKKTYDEIALKECLNGR